MKAEGTISWQWAVGSWQKAGPSVPGTGNSGPEVIAGGMLTDGGTVKLFEIQSSGPLAHNRRRRDEA